MVVSVVADVLVGILSMDKNDTRDTINNQEWFIEKRNAFIQVEINSSLYVN